MLITYVYFGRELLLSGRDHMLNRSKATQAHVSRKSKRLTRLIMKASGLEDVTLVVGLGVKLREEPLKI